uniref:Uncharacterized protein n=1 Tax=Strongyloides venezuelensis TaxID=75913 RepID=A0A0K0G5U0_STRVS
MNDSKLSPNRSRFFYLISEFIYLRNALNQMLNAIEKEINEAERMVTANEKDVNEKLVNHIKFSDDNFKVAEHLWFDKEKK